MSRRAAIYARFSTDLQNERSVDDQIALCRDYAAREGFTVVEVYSDSARSGASIFGRDGLMGMLAACELQTLRFDIVLVEHADRLSRDIEDLAGIHKRLDFRGIEIRALNSGTIDTTTVGLFGLVAQMQREEGAKKTRRGLKSVVRSGRSAGGRLYGYRPVPGQPGEITIDEDEAAVVRRIFDDYNSGLSPREIAAALNRDGVRPPRGDRWNASTLNGCASRGYGILRNDLYAGRRIWNKVAMRRNPANGKRISRPNAAAEHVITEVPHLAIVAPDVFSAASLRKAADGRSHPSHARRPRHLLSGLLRCPCGAGMSAKGADKTGRNRVECSAHRESGSCPDPHVFYIDRIERKVLETLRAEMDDPQILSAFISEYHAERKRLATRRMSQRANIERKLAELGREQLRLVDVMAKTTGDVPELIARTNEITAERAQLQIELERQPEPEKVIALHPAALVHYEALVKRLQNAIGRAAVAGDPEASQALRDLVETVTVRPGNVKGDVAIEIVGRLNALLGDYGFPNVASGGMVVAREGLEPPTRGL
ncbi:recombinase family protein [Hyphomonas sp.]|uniref:recombinase family protein n=1 Tax=Hyphomonas sp. TaxID=87 RepID=UPI003452D73C